MSKFKVGDKVRVVSGRYADRCAGRTGTVEDDDGGGCVCDFGPGFDGWGQNSQRWYVQHDSLEAVAASSFTEGQRVWLACGDGHKTLVTYKKSKAVVEFSESCLTLADFDELTAATPEELAAYDKRQKHAEAVQRLSEALDGSLYDLGEAVTIDDDELDNKTGAVAGFANGIYKVAVIANDNSLCFFEYTADELSAAA
jgi:hypothetical protein